jgi:hypothetical protein
MRYGLALVTTLAWALWFGGLMALFLFVSHLFRADRATAVVAAPKMFLAFERYQIMLAAVALIASAAWRLSTPRAMLTALFFLFALAASGTIVSATLITPRMEELRKQGESSSPAFRQLHGKSMMVYTSEAALLLIGGLILPAALRPPRRTDREAADPTTPPA